MPGSTINIQIAEDQAITRFGLRCALETYADLKVVAESADGLEAVLHALAYKPDIILMDIGLPKIDGIQASKQIKEALPSARIIMFTASDDDQNIYDSLGAGADGYCLKNVAGEHLYSAIKAVSKGVAWLDPGVADRVLRTRQAKPLVAHKDDPGALDPTLNENQMMVLQLLSQGASLEDVASRFNVSTDSVSLMVNATIALLSASAAGHLPQQYEEPVRGTVIGDRYAIESVLGRGGMGIVYKGRHLLMDRPVAIKMLHPENAEDEVTYKRFQSEAKSLSALSHPNLVSVFDFGLTANKEPYMVMDYHNGKGLDEILHETEKVSASRGISIFCQVCDALTAVHERSMVHRDIKPGNIVISDAGLVKLVDFGIVKKVDNKINNLTMAGEVVGTPKYMSPEQCMGKDLQATSDIYSLGCVMYEVFTGAPPFDADSFYEMVRHHVDHSPSRLPFRAAPEIPAKLEAIILKSMAKDPSQRYQSTAQLKEELLAVRAGTPVNV
jgi:DNA-binding NarL/FixJ family response regulator/tRNA A-37 threonylcarbamoyl transferase component Bud32